MGDIIFEIGGRRVNPNNIGDSLERAVFEGLKSEISKKIKNIRDPKTGHFPKVIVKGSSIENLSFEVEGPAEVIELVKKRLA